MRKLDFMKIIKSVLGILIATMGSMMLQGTSVGLIYLNDQYSSDLKYLVFEFLSYGICHYLAFRLIDRDYLKWLIWPILLWSLMFWKDHGVNTIINSSIIIAALIFALYIWMKKKNMLTTTSN